MPIDSSDALQVVRHYVEQLNLGYETLYGEARITNEKEYQVPVTLKDRDDTTLNLSLWVHSETGQLREQPFYRLTREQVTAGMDRRKEHTIVITTKDVDSARQLVDDVYERDGVLGAVVWDYDGSRFFSETSALTQIRRRGMRGPTPVVSREKPENETKRNLLKGSYLR